MNINVSKFLVNYSNISRSCGNLNFMPLIKTIKRCFLPHQMILFVLSAISFIFITIFTLKGILLHEIFGTSAYDMGLFDQTLWLTSQFEPIFNTVRGLHAHGDHFKPIQLIFVPLYKIYPSIYWALFLQSVSVGASAIVLFFLVKEFMPEKNFVPAIFSFCFLLNPVVHNTLRWQYHDIVLAYPLFFSMILYYKRNDILRYILLLILVLCCREDMPFITIGIGIIALIEKKWKFAVWTIGISIFWWLIAVYLFMPLLNQQGYFRHKHGVLQMLFSQLGNMDFYIERFFRAQDGRSYLLYVFCPLIGLPFLKPIYLLPSIAPLAINMLIGAYNTDINYHYSVNVMPFVFFAAFAGYAKLKIFVTDDDYRRVITWAILILLIGTHIYAFSKLSVFHIKSFKSDYQIWQDLSSVRQEVRKFRKQLGASGLATSDFILPHFAHRKHIYLLPNPWEIHYWGIAGENPHHPNNVNFIIIYKNEYMRYARLINYLISEDFFKEIGKSNHFLLYERINKENLSRKKAVESFRNYFADGDIVFKNIKMSNTFSTGINQFGNLHFDAAQGTEDSKIYWKSQSGSPSNSLILDFSNHFADSAYRTVYVSCDVHVQKACNALLMLGSDDGLTVWANGKKIHEKLVLRPIHPGEDMVKMALKKGTTTLLFRVNNAEGAWRLHAAIEPVNFFPDCF